MNPKDLPRSPWRARSTGRMQAVSAAVLLCISLAQQGTAQAVVMGRVVVQSRVGEPLRAELDLSDITPQDAANLQVSISRSVRGKAAGLQTNPALSDLQISLQRRDSGRLFLLLSTRSTLTEPFMDLVLEAQWPSGRSVREYTLVLKPGQPVADASTEGTAPPTTAVPVIQARTDPMASDRGSSTANQVGQQVLVNPGDTAGQIASLYRPAEVSLDQMLLALQRANPQAFVGGNINRIKAGALILIPDIADTQAIAPEEARQAIAAQSRDFNEFRRRLAGAARPVQAQGNERQSSGKIQAEVKEERGPAPLTDKLVLSKGSVSPNAAEEEVIAQQARARDNASQLETLSRNIEALDQLRAQVPEALPASTSAAPTQPGETPSPLTSPAGSGQAPSAENSTNPPNPSGVELGTNTSAVPNVPPSSSKIESFIQQPWVVPVAGSLLVLLAGVGIVFSQRRPKSAGPNRASPAHRFEPDPVFDNASPRISGNAAKAPPTPRLALPWKPAQPEEADPVSEADVYLAYGRDLQAEKLLRADLAANPKHLATCLKLLDIYAMRRDARGFEALALIAHGLTQGRGLQWDSVCKKGRLLDAGHSLYGFDAHTAGAEVRPDNGTQAHPLSSDRGVESSDPDLVQEPQGTTGTAANRPAEPRKPAVSGTASEVTPQSRARPEPVDFDFDFPPEMAEQIQASAQSGPRSQPPPEELSEDFELDDSLELPNDPSRSRGQDLAQRLDWASLNLDLNADTSDGLLFDGFARVENPMEAQFAMAQTLLAVGDLAAARAAAEAVYADANGILRIKAARFLAMLR
jgi:pilus assembly protein FimV